MATIFVPKETVPGETRVAAVAETVKKKTQAGFKVTVQSGAGTASRHADETYRDAGAAIVPDAAAGYREADIVLKLHAPSEDEVGMLREGTFLVSFLFPFNNPGLVAKLRDRKITAFAMDQIPRITRAQSMDALSSQANIAGYKAVIMGAEHLGKIFPLLMTAAGTITPAKVVILGAGVAGLQAIATAKRLGAVVEVSDIRPAVKEQVLSLGGKFIEVETTEDMEAAGGYAKQVSEDFLRRQREIVDKHMEGADVVIGTAQVPGKPAPKLISAAIVEKMRAGSVIVDLAAEAGGNCELTEPGQIVVRNGVTIIGTRNVPALVPVHASDVYAKNLLNIMNHLGKDGELKLDFEDEITAGSIVVHGGEVRRPELAEAITTGGRS
jgi:NAD(P) transhydrogenase subunit alpha